MASIYAVDVVSVAMSVAERCNKVNGIEITFERHLVDQVAKFRRYSAEERALPLCLLARFGVNPGEDMSALCDVKRWFEAEGLQLTYLNRDCITMELDAETRDVDAAMFNVTVAGAVVPT